MNTTYKALYPSIIDESNMSPPTQHGKVLLPEKLDEMENRFNNDYFDRQVWFMEDYISHDYLNFAARYLHLATYEEMFNDILEYFSTVEAPQHGVRRFDTLTGKKVMVRIIPKDSKREMCRIVDNTKPREMVIIREKMEVPNGVFENN